jgi:hypothetical protein
MITRCENPKSIEYEVYGGRGITVCDRWRISFENFLADMGDRPTPKHTIDRIDNAIGYCPENCRWATMKEQQRNRRNNRLISFDGKTATLAEWAEISGNSSDIISWRIKQGWNLRSAIFEPTQRKAA